MEQLFQAIRRSLGSWGMFAFNLVNSPLKIFIYKYSSWALSMNSSIYSTFRWRYSKLYLGDQDSQGIHRIYYCCQVRFLRPLLVGRFPLHSQLQENTRAGQDHRAETYRLLVSVADVLQRPTLPSDRAEIEHGQVTFSLC